MEHISEAKINQRVITLDQNTGINVKGTISEVYQSKYNKSYIEIEWDDLTFPCHYFENEIQNIKLI